MRHQAPRGAPQPRGLPGRRAALVHAAAATTRSWPRCSGCAATRTWRPSARCSCRASAARAALPALHEDLRLPRHPRPRVSDRRGRQDGAARTSHVFVNTGDGDCCSIGAAHWIHAIRYNMNLTVILHDNHVYGLTKKQASPTSPHGMKSNTTPRGAMLEPMNPLTVTLGVQNASFVAQGVDWVPEVLYDIIASRVPAPRLLVRARHPALPRVHAQGVRAVAARPGEDAAADARRRPAALSPRRAGIYRTSASTIRSTSTGRARSPRPRIRSRSASSTATPTCPATRTCATPDSRARPSTSAPGSRRSSTRSRSGRTRTPAHAQPEAGGDTHERQPHGHGSQIPGPTGLPHDRQPRRRRPRADRRGLDCVRRCSAGYRDLTRLRYDFPLVLVGSGGRRRVRAFAVERRRPRCSTMLAPRGIEGERLRRHVLQLEREIRAMRRRGRAGHAGRALGRAPPNAWARAATRRVEQVLAQAGDCAAGRRRGRWAAIRRCRRG